MGSSNRTRQDQDGDASSDRPEARLLVESLTEAQRSANELKACLQLEQSSSSSSMDPLALVEGISESLSRAIMLLRQSQSTGRRSPLMVPAPARRGSSGGYKRRKESRSSMDDGYSWRKYGQKEIFAAKYPRSYFRCKHKYEQLCPATRQVQQSEADPSMLDITYIGDHTCTQNQQAIMDNGIIKRDDVLSPSTEFESGCARRAPADHESTHGDDGAPAHLDGSFAYVTASDLQVTFDGHYTYYTAAAGGDFDEELAAAAPSLGGFTSTSTSAMIWELISSNNTWTD